MRIAIDARWNYHAGVSVYVEHLLRELPGPASERGIEIYAYEAPSRPNAQSHPNLHKVAIESGCYAPKAQLELARRAREDKIDLFHAPFYWSPLRMPCPVLVTIHDLIPFLFPTYGRLHRTIVKAGYRLSARCATHLACISESTRRDVMALLKVPAEKITRVYNCVDARVFNAQPAPGEKEYLRERYGIEGAYVMAPSASNWQTKNLDGALRAIERARDKSDQSFQTVITGSPEGLEQTGLRAKLRNAVATGRVPSEDLPKLYRNATVFLSLSKYEGFGLPLAEAMSCGTACISSRGGSLPEIAGDGARVCNGGDAEEVSDAIVDLLEHGEKRADLMRRALEQSQKFSIASCTQNMLHLYERLASAKG